MLVIDASALVELLTVDPDDCPDLAHRMHDVEWMSAPDLIDYEVLNVLRKMVLRGDIDVELADESRLAVRHPPLVTTGVDRGDRRAGVATAAQRLRLRRRISRTR